MENRLSGALAQLGAHDTGSVGVRGSSPLCSTKRVLDEHLLFRRRLRREMFALIPKQKTPSWICSKAAFYYVCNRHIRIIFHPLVKWKYNRKQEDKHIGKIVIWINGWDIHTTRRLCFAKSHINCRKSAYWYMGTAARSTPKTVS